MRTAEAGLAALTLLAAAALGGACEEVRVDRLYAIRIEGAPPPAGRPPALPLLLKVGGGNVSGPDRRLAELAMDTDEVHAGSASCHHGPPITSPVPVEARASYTDRELRLELRWRDPTEDRTPRQWVRGPGGWRLGEGDQDGVAVLWSRAETPFGCQEACHMRDFALRRGEVVDLRAMFLAGENDWEEAWIWKPSRGGEALILERSGFRTTGGDPYRIENSAAAANAALRPEARRAGAFGPEDRPLRGEEGASLAADAARAPAYLFASAPDRGGLAAAAEREGKGWRVVFTRTLAAGPRRQEFRPGGRYRFGVAVFDGTSTDHHILRDAQSLELVPRRESRIIADADPY